MQGDSMRTILRVSKQKRPAVYTSLQATSAGRNDNDRIRAFGNFS